MLAISNFRGQFSESFEDISVRVDALEKVIPCATAQWEVISGLSMIKDLGKRVEQVEEQLTSENCVQTPQRSRKDRPPTSVLRAQ